jgi:hypothetical protein
LIHRTEIEVRELADSIYRRVDWRWMQNGQSTVWQGWKPESGYLHYGWEGYSEAMLLYVVGMASPTFPLSMDSYNFWTSTYQWENLYGYDFLYAGPLFIHQYSHAWLDLRTIQDRFMRERRSDYFENSRRAVLIQRQYAQRNPTNSGVMVRIAGHCRPPKVQAGRRRRSGGKGDAFSVMLRVESLTDRMTGHSVRLRFWVRSPLHRKYSGRNPASLPAVSVCCRRLRDTERVQPDPRRGRLAILGLSYLSRLESGDHSPDGWRIIAPSSFGN